MTAFGRWVEPTSGADGALGGRSDEPTWTAPRQAVRLPPRQYDFPPLRPFLVYHPLTQHRCIFAVLIAIAELVASSVRGQVPVPAIHPFADVKSNLLAIAPPFVSLLLSVLDDRSDAVQHAALSALEFVLDHIGCRYAPLLLGLIGLQQKKRERESEGTLLCVGDARVAVLDVISGNDTFAYVGCYGWSVSIVWGRCLW